MNLRDAFAKLHPILAAVQAAGGYPLIVGGAVRDVLLERTPHDIDIEVYQLTFDQLRAALEPFGRVQTVGKSFGVIKLRYGDYELDLSLPSRARQPVERGAIAPPDPTITPREAAARRDFTCNAIAVAPDGSMLDFFGGAQDLQARVLRHTSTQFGDDPLRVLRGMQFAARFDMQLALETIDVCRALLPAASELALERVWVEWAKWAVQGVTPAAGLRVLEQTGWLAVYPELAALVGCEQDPTWHPEGDAWIHTLYVCDAAAAIADRAMVTGDDRAALLFAALGHDLGKPPTTTHEADGRIRSLGHAEAGLELAEAFFTRIGAPRSLVQRVLPPIREHMAHFAKPNARSVRRLAARLQPATIAEWARLVEADHSGRPPLPPRNPAAPVVALAHTMDITTQAPTPLVRGRDLIAVGFAAGPSLGTLVKHAYEAQLDGAFDTAEAGVTWVVQRGDFDGIGT